ncbi:hypothetical protein [Mycoplasma hafezii]|uniref:hypothetical protein n=1 Tax=Mycoplasma hafezii TaxID=525886 RepID=UPI003CE76A97
MNDLDRIVNLLCKNDNRLVVQGSYALYKFGWLDRKPNDIDLLLLIEEDNLKLRNKEFEKIIKEKINNTSINGHEYFKHFEIYNGEKLTNIECMVFKKIKKDWVILENSVQYIKPYICIIFKFCQIITNYYFYKFQGINEKLQKIIRTFSDIELFLISNEIDFDELKRIFKEVSITNIQFDILSYAESPYYFLFQSIDEISKDIKYKLDQFPYTSKLFLKLFYDGEISQFIANTEFIWDIKKIFLSTLQYWDDNKLQKIKNFGANFEFSNIRTFVFFYVLFLNNLRIKGINFEIQKLNKNILFLENGNVIFNFYEWFLSYLNS